MKTSIFFSLFALVLSVSAGADTDTVVVDGLPYSTQHNGVFVISGSYNGFPVYKSLKNGDWVMYKRRSGQARNKWVLDSNAIDETWAGTVAWSKADVNRPWLSAWDGPNPGKVSKGTGTDTITVSGLPYAARHNGVFVLTGSYNSHYVYTSLKNKDWKVYKRMNGQAGNKWVLDFNAIDETWAGTVAWSKADVNRPWLSAWDGPNPGSASPTAALATIYVSGLPYADRHNGAFTLTGSYNDHPVYTSTKNKDWKIYKRKSGNARNKWVLDFDSIDEAWSGTVAFSTTDAYRPWLSAWDGGREGGKVTYTV